jgi:hypothetical protein
LEGSVYTTPLVSPLFRDDHKQIVSTTFLEYIELVEHDGHKPSGIYLVSVKFILLELCGLISGWPVGFERRGFHSSPLLYDMDHDGIQDIIVADSDARLLWLRLGDFGQYLHDIELVVPKLKVRKNW